MARTLRASNAASAAAGAATLTCPECGKTFTRAASLGAHRSRAHGVSGASKRRTGSGGASNSGTTRRITRAREQTRVRGRTRASSGGGGINRDALLQTLFPNGLPAREEIIRRANAWLDEAEQLAKAK